MDEMFDRLQAVVDRYDELNELISDPEVIADTRRFMALSKEEADLRDTVEAYREFQKKSRIKSMKTTKCYVKNLMMKWQALLKMSSRNLNPKKNSFGRPNSSALVT